MFKLGLNPYGLTYGLGLQGRGTPRVNPHGRGLEGFIEIARELRAKTIELFAPWLAEMSDGDLARLRERLDALGMEPVVSSALTGMGPVEGALRFAKALGANTIRLGLSPVLEGSRNAWGAKWLDLVASIRADLSRYAPHAAGQGVVLAIENHQDFTSAELVDFCTTYGPGLGVCFDTGNSFPVAESPLDFARRVAPFVRHVHLKDYRVQFTPEGFRLIRCAIGDGAVPFAEIAGVLREHHAHLTAVLEPGALEARHIRLFTPEWWNGYPAKPAPELAACLLAAQRNGLPADADTRTLWEKGEEGEALAQYELAMIRRSAALMQALDL